LLSRTTAKTMFLAVQSVAPYAGATTLINEPAMLSAGSSLADSSLILSPANLGQGGPQHRARDALASSLILRNSKGRRSSSFCALTSHIQQRAANGREEIADVTNQQKRGGAQGIRSCPSTHRSILFEEARRTTRMH